MRNIDWFIMSKNKECKKKLRNVLSSSNKCKRKISRKKIISLAKRSNF